jgi:hypothetical protein
MGYNFCNIKNQVMKPDLTQVINELHLKNKSFGRTKVQFLSGTIIGHNLFICRLNSELPGLEG